MTSNIIKQELIKIIFELFKAIEFDCDFIEYVDLVDDLGMDSIIFISMIVEIESKFKITIPDEMLLIENFRKVENIVSYVITEKSKV